MALAPSGEDVYTVIPHCVISETQVSTKHHQLFIHPWKELCLP